MANSDNIKEPSEVQKTELDTINYEPEIPNDADQKNVLKLENTRQSCLD